VEAVTIAWVVVSEFFEGFAVDDMGKASSHQDQ